MPKALVLLAPGAEEMETTIAVDVLRRGGVNVLLAGLGGSGPVRCSRGLQIVPDQALDQVRNDQTFDVVVLPGGARGAEALARHPGVGQLLRAQVESGQDVAAICAAPAALVAHGLFPGFRMTCHPSVEHEVSRFAQLARERVVEDRNLITSGGPGTSFEFALTLVRRLMGEATARGLRGPMLLDP